MVVGRLGLRLAAGDEAVSFFIQYVDERLVVGVPGLPDPLGGPGVGSNRSRNGKTPSGDAPLPLRSSEPFSVRASPSRPPGHAHQRRARIAVGILVAAVPDEGRWGVRGVGAMRQVRAAAVVPPLVDERGLTISPPDAACRKCGTPQGRGFRLEGGGQQGDLVTVLGFSAGVSPVEGLHHVGVADWSARHPMVRLPVRTEPNGTGTSSARGRSARTLASPGLASGRTVTLREPGDGDLVGERSFDGVDEQPSTIGRGEASSTSAGGRTGVWTPSSPTCISAEVRKCSNRSSS